MTSTAFTVGDVLPYKPYPKSTVSAYATAPMPTVKHVAQANVINFLLRALIRHLTI